HYEKVFHISLSIIFLTIILLSIPDSSLGKKEGIIADDGLISCSETDKGTNFEKKGTTCDASGCNTDQCNADGKTLTEYACLDGSKNPQASTCPGVCYNGACRAQPNFLLIMADDSDPALHGFLGHPTIKTPNLDAIADKGAVFTNGWTTMSFCRPALASILSGQFPNENYIFSNYSDVATPNDSLLTGSSIISLLKDYGYDNFIGGKWWENGYTQPELYGFTHIGELGRPFVRETQQSLFDFLDYATTSNKPFFVWYAPSLPHLGHDAPTQFQNAFTDADVAVPAGIAPADVPNFIIDQKKFFATIYWFDTRLGEVINKLKQNDQLKNTIIIYMNDNGFAYDYVSKGGMFEKGMKTPIVIKVPDGFEQTRTFSNPASIVDIPRTILDYANIPAPASSIEFPRTWVSMKPLLEEQTNIYRHTLAEGVYSQSFLNSPSIPFAEYANALYAIIAKNNQKKYIHYLETFGPTYNPGIFAGYTTLPEIQAGDEAFYDLTADPWEQNNLINDPNQTEAINNLKTVALELENRIMTAGAGSAQRQATTVIATEDKPACVYNQEYASINDCLCGPVAVDRENLLTGKEIQTGRWSVFANNGITCTPDQKNIAICRPIILDTVEQKALVPQEVMARLNSGVTLEQIQEKITDAGAIIRQQPCNWQKNSKFNNLIVETPVNQESATIASLRSSGLILSGNQNQQVVCVPQGPTR
ncbi:MAG: sulfatase-like hydrolase/transferase, partial [Patescibacteria group bacterium]